MSTFREEFGQELSYLYSAALAEIENFESNLSPGDLSAKQVLRAHFAIANHFSKLGEGIGGFGPKDSGLLCSALSRQFVGYGGQQKWVSVFDKAATLLYGLVMNHPFYDANKRTAYLSTVHYLFANGHTITVSEKALEDMTVWVASKQLSRFPRYRDLTKRDEDPEVRFLSHYLRQNTRKIDRQQYFVTYRELDKILRRYGAWMENPNNNTIDVMRRIKVEKRVGIFSKPRSELETHRVCKLGFPGWTRQVGKGRLKYIRQQLNLMPADGVDSQAFFKDLDDMTVLLELYEGALKRLADR